MLVNPTFLYLIRNAAQMSWTWTVSVWIWLMPWEEVSSLENFFASLECDPCSKRQDIGMQLEWILGMAWKILWTKLGSQGERDRKPKDHSREREDGTVSNLVYFSEDLLTEPYVCLPDVVFRQTQEEMLSR